MQYLFNRPKSNKCYKKKVTTVVARIFAVLTFFHSVFAAVVYPSVPSFCLNTFQIRLYLFI